jgi:ADP-ribose diphosphatase
MNEKQLPTIHEMRERDAGKWLKLEQLDLEFSNGEKRIYHRMRTRGLGAVIIVPMLDDDTVLLAREYAAGLHHYEIGLPKGRLEEGESIIEAAEREMKEEIGYGARDLIELTELSLAPGYMTHVTHIVLARDLYPEKLEGDEPEELEVVPWPIANLRQLTAREDCTEGRTIAALYIARDHLQAGGSNA